MSARSAFPARPEPAEGPEDLRELQAQWDAEAAEIDAAGPRFGAPSLLDAWSDLWRSAPRADKRDLFRLACLTPSMLWLAAVIWWATP